MHSNHQSCADYDPHGYEPLLVDENCLGSEDCRQALREAIERPRNWRSYLTKTELDQLDNVLAESKKRKSPYACSPGESSEERERRSAAAQLAILRAFARIKYNHGQRFWYGDAPPWAQSGNSQ